MDDLLFAFLSTDNAHRQAAEQAFAQQKQANPRNVLEQLCQAISNSTSEANRSLAAVLLRGIVVREPKLWGALSADEVDKVRTLILECLMRETVGHVQRKIANLAASHAKLSPWPALMAGVMQLSQSSEFRHNELSLFLVDKLAEYIPDVLKKELTTVGRIIEPFLMGSRGDMKTRAVACQALCSVVFEMSAADGETGLEFCRGVNRVAEFLATALAAGEELLLQDVLTSLQQISKERSQLLHSSFVPLCEVCTAICHADPNIIEGGTKVLALGIVVDLHSLQQSASFATATTRQSCLLLCMTLLALVDDDDDTVSSCSRPEGEDNGFGDVAGDGDDGNVADFAAMSLDALAGRLDPQEVVSVCLSSAWSLVSGEDWRGRRAALLTASLICEGASEAMGGLLAQLVPTIVTLLADPHPRVRINAVHALGTFIEGFSGTDDDEVDDEEISLQKMFPTVPQALCECIQANFAYPRIVYAGLSALKAFFNPDACPDALCEPYAVSILDFCSALLVSSTTPWFVRGECASVLGHVCLLYGEQLMDPVDRYTPIITALKGIIWSSETFADLSMQHEVSLVKARCLESASMVGKAVGREVFSPVAEEILQLAVQAVCDGGRDASDPVKSYLMQTSARIAGVLGDSFEPYVGVLLPPLLERIGAEVAVQIVDGEGGAGVLSGLDDAGAGGGEGGDVFTVYKRGVGHIKVQCNTHEIAEKEIACRCLYQYCQDVPALMWPRAEAIVDAIVAVLSSVLSRSADLYMIVGAILCGAVKMFTRYSCHLATPADDPACARSVDRLTEKALRALVAVYRVQTQAFASAYTQGQRELSLALSEAIYNLLDVRWTARHSHHRYNQWPISLPVDLIHECFSAVREDLTLFVHQRYVEGHQPAFEEDQVTEDDHWSKMIDVMGLLLKLFGNFLQEVFVADLLPFLNGLLANKSSPPLLLRLPICVLIDVIEFLPSLAESCSAVVLPHLLTQVNQSEIAIACVYGIGVCAANGGASFDPHVSRAIALLLGAAGADPQAALALALPKDIDPSLVRDNALSSLLKISIWRGPAMGPVGPSMMTFCLQSLPLTGDLQEAVAVHDWVIGLVAGRDPRLFGNNFEHLALVLAFLAKLAAIDDEGRCDAPCIDQEEDEEFWGAFPVTAGTLIQCRRVLRAGLTGGIPTAVLTPAMNTIPKEMKKILKRYSNIKT